MMIRKPKYRSQAFHNYLERQTPERRAELIATETGYEEERRARERVNGMDPAERDFLESMGGYEDKPAGPSRRIDIADL
jgi:hypothetical protein